MTTTIQLNDLRFYAYHGVMPHERIVGTHYRVGVRFEADLSVASLSDDVQDTINYADVYNKVKAEMEIPSKLIEHVAYRILQSIKKAFPQIKFIEVRVAKMCPPIQGDAGSAEIIISA